MTAQGSHCMQLVARGNWRTSQTTRLVAALAALGVPITTDRVWRDRTGDERVTYRHASRSVDPLRAALPPVKTLVKMYRKGELQTKDPAHPLLDALRVIAILETLRAWIKTGQPHQLARCAPGRYLLTPGEPARAAAIVRTASIYRAAALILHGHAVARIEEPEKGHPAFIIDNAAAVDPAAPSASTAPTAAQLITQHRDNALAETHPFAFAVAACRAFDRLFSHVEDQVFVLMFNAKLDPRYGFIREDATPAARLSTERFIAHGSSR